MLLTKDPSLFMILEEFKSLKILIQYSSNYSADNQTLLSSVFAVLTKLIGKLFGF